MGNLIRIAIRISAFVRKEIVEVWRQPRLLLTLVIGPFLILLLFGLGYQTDPRTMQTLLVVPPDSKIADIVDEYAERITGQLELIGTISDLEQAREELLAGSVDIVVTTPADPYGEVLDNRQAVFGLYHQEIDPFERTYMDVVQQAYVDEFNKQALVEMAEYGQQEVVEFQTYIQDAADSAAGMRQALEEGDREAAQAHQEELEHELGVLTAAAGSGLMALALIQNDGDLEKSNLRERLLSEIERMQEQLDALPEVGHSEDLSSEIEIISTIEDGLDSLDQRIEQFLQIDAQVLTRPFLGETHAVTATEIADTHYFVPAVIALLLQHISITLAGLSIIRERRDGTMELFRASPISAIETLIGKYISYTLLVGVVAAALTGLVIWVLEVPMLGSWGNYLLILLGITASSLGIGFLISLLSRTDSQAVQYAMIFLLASIFFSGFFIALYRLSSFVYVVSWSLPATYGISLLQDTMLRGRPINLPLLAALFGIALILFIAASWRLRQVMWAR